MILAQDIDIIETGLRPGEKLYEELLIRTEEMDKTGNSLIFVERDKPLSEEAVRQKLDILRKALEKNDDGIVRQALKQVIPTFREPEEINRGAAESMEMKAAGHAGKMAG